MAVLAQFPKDFAPDLRRLKSWPSMKGSLWRQPYLVQLTRGENFRLVKEAIQRKNLRILEVGCGTGFMSLELARIGHYVTAIDRNKDLVSLAERTRRADPYKKSLGGLSYETADFNTWTGRPGNYDVVLFCRILHDMPHPSRVLAKAREQLNDRGRLVCLEYAYDQMNRRAAAWIYQIRRILEVAGWSRSPRLTDNAQKAVDNIMEKSSKRKQHINTFGEMQQPLRQLFHETLLSWHPYYCWNIFQDMLIPNKKQEKNFATLLKSMEEFLIKSKEIQPVLFRFVGTKKRH